MSECEVGLVEWMNHALFNRLTGFLYRGQDAQGPQEAALALAPVPMEPQPAVMISFVQESVGHGAQRARADSFAGQQVEVLPPDSAAHRLSAR